MEEFAIQCMHSKVNIKSDIPLRCFFERNKDNIEFPNLHILDKDMSDSKYEVIYKDSCKKTIICSHRKIFISYPKEELSASNIAYMCRYFVEKQFAEKGMFTCHSAAVEKDGKAILLLGNEGAGKTSLALNLCINKGYNLISNDQTLIGIKDNKLFTFWGSCYLNLRLRSVKDNLPSLLYLFENADHNVCAWNNKINTTAKSIGVSEQLNPTPIDSIYFIHIDAMSSDFIINKGDTWRNSFLLFSNLSQQIRGSSSTFVDKHGHPIGYVPSYDNVSIYRKRQNLFNKIMDCDKIASVSGNINKVMKYIDNIHLKNNDVNFLQEVKSNEK